MEGQQEEKHKVGEVCSWQCGEDSVCALEVGGC